MSAIASTKPIETREPTVLEAGKQLGKAVVRSLSFKRRRRATTGTQTVTVVDSATEPMDLPPAMSVTAAPGADPRHPMQVQRRTSFSIDTSTSVTTLPPRASAVREAVCQLTRRTSMQRASIKRDSSHRLSLAPPRASEVRAAMRPLYGDETEPTLGLTKSPTQPELVAHVIKRASMGPSAFRAARVERRRERRLARFMSVQDSQTIITPPPRASDIARAVGGLDQT